MPRYSTDGANAITPLPWSAGQEVPLEYGTTWTVQAVTANFAALTRPVTDADRAEIYAEYDVPDDCTGQDCDHLGCHSEAPNLERSTVWYTVVDWRNGVRGPCNLVGQGASRDGKYSAEECVEILAQFESGNFYVSQRNFVPIRVVDGQVTSRPVRLLA